MSPKLFKILKATLLITGIILFSGFLVANFYKGQEEIALVMIIPSFLLVMILTYIINYDERKYWSLFTLLFPYIAIPCILFRKQDDIEKNNEILKKQKGEIQETRHTAKPLKERFYGFIYNIKENPIPVTFLLLVGLLIFSKNTSVLLFIGGFLLLTILVFISIFENYEFGFYDKTILTIKRVVVYFPLAGVLLFMTLCIVMDIRLFTASDQTQGEVLRQRSKVFVYKSSRKTSSRSDWIEYSYSIDDEKVETTQHYFTPKNMPGRGATTVIYDIAFPTLNSKVKGSWIPHIFWFLPWFIWTTIGAGVWIKITYRLLED